MAVCYVQLAQALKILVSYKIKTLPKGLQHKQRSKLNSNDQAASHIYYFTSVLKSLSFLNFINSSLTNNLPLSKGKFIFISVRTFRNKRTKLSLFCVCVCTQYIFTRASIILSPSTGSPPWYNSR